MVEEPTSSHNSQETTHIMTVGSREEEQGPEFQYTLRNMLSHMTSHLPLTC